MTKVITKKDGSKTVFGKKGISTNLPSDRDRSAPSASGNTLVASRSAETAVTDLSIINDYNVLFERYSKKLANSDSLWDDSDYTSASDKVDAHTNTERTWMAHPAHRDAYQISIWGGLKETHIVKGESVFVHLGMWDKAIVATDPHTNKKGILVSSGAIKKFYTDSEISSLHYSERPEAKSSSVRADEWNARQPYYSNDIA